MNVPVIEAGSTAQTNFHSFAGESGGEAERETLRHWRGDIGRAWLVRNASSFERVDDLTHFWGQLQGYIGHEIGSILEVGAGTGDCIEAALNVWPHMQRAYAVEPNTEARRELSARFEKLYVFDGSATQLPLGDDTMDLVFTSGCLIHVPPKDLPRAYREIHRVSRKWIVIQEYFSAEPEEKTWRGRDGLLFKRDFGQLWVDLFPTLSPVACGFAWKKITGLDNITWWIFRK